MKEIMEINSLARKCGYFEGSTGVNNGYGCTHPKQEETDEATYFDSSIGKEITKECGKCYAWACPLAYTADYEDCNKTSPETCKDCNKEECENGGYESCELVVVETDGSGKIITKSQNSKR